MPWLNICPFYNCGIEFRILDHLIVHIESTHHITDAVLTYHSMLDPPYSIALSYIIRYTTPWMKKVHPTQQGRTNLQLQQIQAPEKPRSSPSECIDDESEDSNNSWATTQGYSSDFILEHGIRKGAHQGGSGAAEGGDVEKPFACPVPGCKKRYKNVNGIKYHSKNGHKKDGKVKKAYKCHCGKSYRIAQGLKNHTTLKHPTSAPNVTSAPKSSQPLIILTNAEGVTASASPKKIFRIYEPGSGQHYNVENIMTQTTRYHHIYM